jgi:MYXO-CTERM domain-containing protein
MKTVRALTALIGLGITGSAYAQLATLPPDSTADGVPVQSIGANAGTSHWEDPNGLAAYNIASNVYVPLTGPDAITGLTWGSSTPSAITSALSTINSGGGTIRGIYVGESAGWLNDFGYTYNKSPVTAPLQSFTVFHNVQAVGTPDVAFGDHFDVDVLAGTSANFDFWLNASGTTTTNKSSGTTNGGVYTAINQSNSTPFLESGNVRWSQTPLSVSTWVPTANGGAGAYENVNTYLASFEDWRLDHTADRDFSDFILGVQLFDVNGVPIGGPTPVPEASTYGILGAVGLLGLAAWRRKKATAVA